MSKSGVAPRVISRTSFLTQLCHSGCKARSRRHQAAVTDVVSNAAKYIVLQLSIINSSAKAVRSGIDVEPSIIECKRSLFNEPCCLCSSTMFRTSECISRFSRCISLFVLVGRYLLEPQLKVTVCLFLYFIK